MVEVIISDRITFQIDRSVSVPKVYVLTGMQRFRLDPLQKRGHADRIRRICDHIENGRISSLDDLSNMTTNKIAWKPIRWT